MSTDLPPSRTAEQFVVRFPDGMRDRIAEAAKASNRSMNAEIVARLQASFGDGVDQAGSQGAIPQEVLLLEIELQRAANTLQATRQAYVMYEADLTRRVADAEFVKKKHGEARYTYLIEGLAKERATTEKARYAWEQWRNRVNDLLQQRDATLLRYGLDPEKHAVYRPGSDLKDPEAFPF